MSNASNNAQRSTLWSLQSVSTLLFKILLLNDCDRNGELSFESRSFSFTILSFIYHVKHWERRRVALVWPCSALAVPLISPMLVCVLMKTFLKNPFCLILVSPALLQLHICCKCWSAEVCRHFQR